MNNARVRSLPILRILSILLLYAACTHPEDSGAPTAGGGDPASAGSEDGGQELEPRPEPPPLLPGDHTDHPDYAPRVLFLGDGLCSPQGIENHQAYPGEVRLRLARQKCIFLPVVDCAADRDSAAALTALEQQLDPDIVVLAIGAADRRAGRPVREIRTGIERLLEIAVGRGARVLLVARHAPRTGDDGDAAAAAFDAMYAELAERERVTLVPSFESALAAQSNWVTGETPTVLGHKQLAAILEPHLRSAIEAYGQSDNRR